MHFLYSGQTKFSISRPVYFTMNADRHRVPPYKRSVVLTFDGLGYRDRGRSFYLRKPKSFKKLQGLKPIKHE